ncbi:MAG: DUF2760 domain-containing protein [Candidatus Anammoxibacter sp.]
MKKSITLQSLLIIFLCNAVFVALYFFMLKHIFQGVDRWVEPFPALGNLTQFLHESERKSIPILFGAGVGFTVISWILVSIFGNKVINSDSADGQKKASTANKSIKKEKKGSITEPDSTQPSLRASLQMLVIFQRQGRLVDFLQEDISQYDDAQVGAAVRNIHTDCKKALKDHVKLEPIFKDEEGQEVTVNEGFDNQAIQLSGNIKGDPPFHGILRHRGWRAAKVQLPKLTASGDNNNVIAPAEVDIV